MVKEDDAPFVGGELVHDRGECNRLILEAPNRRYEARGFVVERQANLAALRKRYYVVNPKHWERISPVLTPIMLFIPSRRLSPGVLAALAAGNY